MRGRRDFKGQGRGVSHQGQEKTLHLKAEYIDADFPSFETFPLHSHGGPYIRQLRGPTTRTGEVGAIPAFKELRDVTCPRWRPFEFILTLERMRLVSINAPGSTNI